MVFAAGGCAVDPSCPICGQSQPEQGEQAPEGKEPGSAQGQAMEIAFPVGKEGEEAAFEVHVGLLGMKAARFQRNEDRNSYPKKVPGTIFPTSKVQAVWIENGAWHLFPQEQFRRDVHSIE